MIDYLSYEIKCNKNIIKNGHYNFFFFLYLSSKFVFKSPDY